jgi:acetyl esterase/lipase
MHAAEWGINPSQVGVLGFSAGGHLAAVLSNHADFKRAGEPADEASVSARPDFTVLIYPAYLTDASLKQIDEGVKPTSETPPTFLLQAEDDPVHEENVLVYFQALKEAKVKGELHVYAEGGHGYGLRANGLPIVKWPSLVTTWLHTIGILH